MYIKSILYYIDINININFNYMLTDVFKIYSYSI